MATTRKHGFFRTALDTLIDARSRQATRYVNGALLALDDKTLEANGYRRSELERNYSPACYF